MKKLSYIGIPFAVALVAVLFFSCEKDDICAEGTITTPLLVIEFFDAASGTEDVPKNVTDFWVEAVDPATEIVDGNVVILDPIQTVEATINTISIPLRTQEGITEYKFISNYELDPNDDDNQLGNIDIVTFNYETQEIFLSRACGYVTNYTLDLTNGISVTTDTDNWILGTLITKINVQDETETHVKIYH